MMKADIDLKVVYVLLIATKINGLALL